MRHPSVSMIRRGPMVISCVLTLLILAACQTERVQTSDGRPMPPKPHPAPAAPAGAIANRMALLVGSKADDTNGNGYPDQIQATVVLFASPHPTPILADGAFVFSLYPMGQAKAAGGEVLAEWRVEGEAVRASQAVARYGPCYRFRLCLLDSVGDVHPLSRADLVCRFEPTDGSPTVMSDGIRSIQIGRRGDSAAR